MPTKDKTLRQLSRELAAVRSQHPQWKDDNAFVYWFVNANVANDEQSAAASVTGLSGDKNLDAVHIDHKLNRVQLVQGKWHPGQTAPAQSRDPVIAFASATRALAEGGELFKKYRIGLNPALLERVDEAATAIQKKHYDLTAYFVTAGRCTAALKTEAMASLRGCERAALVVLDRRDVLNLYRDYLVGAAPPVPYLDLEVDREGLLSQEDVVRRKDAQTAISAWLFTMKASAVGGLYQTAGEKLFARNIRGWLDKTNVNTQMERTLKIRPAMFWFLNNGVTIVCNDALRVEDDSGHVTMRVMNPQIINGQQTTRTLHASGRSAEKAALLVRVISIPREGASSEEQFEESVREIVSGTNWQNAILPSDLRANDSRQVTLERELRRLRYHYLRKRQGKGEAKRTLGSLFAFRVGKTELAQLVGACEFDPDVVRSGKEGLFDDESGYYDKIFNGRSVLEYIAILWVGRTVKYAGKGFPEASYAKWVVLNFLWQELGPLLRGRAAREAFKRLSEPRRRCEALLPAVDRVFDAAHAYYRARRGRGRAAVDVSNFFYRPGQHVGFEKFWRSRKNKYRRAFRRAIERFRIALQAEMA